MDISIVSGTFNRLNSLKNMVKSGRKSIGNPYGLEFEFVLVDGGSTDGTIEWCVAQDDIHLIQHGELRGAVQAFNDGAYAALGIYTILANDDIEFVSDSILRAYVYMQRHVECGIGCFYQDRNGHDWHVESMPVVRDKKQTSAPYGQVCIVPKVLGDQVGWWGDYLHTYGGDNEISSNVYELGYRVSPIPGAKIHDNELDDQLRQINNIDGKKDPKAMQGHHPDSWEWGRKWRRAIDGKGLVGPIVRDEPDQPLPIEVKERIVYLPIYEQNYPVQKEQKRGLRDTLAMDSIVAEFDYVGLNDQVGKEALMRSIQDYCLTFQPTIVLTQLHNQGIITAADIQHLRQYAPDAIFVNWNGDVWEDNLLSDEGIQLARTFDLQTVVNRAVLPEYEKLGVKAAYWEIGYEPDGVGHEAEQSHDLVFLGSGYSSERQTLIKKVKDFNLDFALYGSGWPAEWTNGDTLYNFSEGCKIYRGAKLALSDAQWSDAPYISNRVLQILVAGNVALLQQEFKEMDTWGLIDKETCIIWNTPIDLQEKIKYYLHNEKERKAIAENGQKMALEKHSFAIRVEELYQLLERATPEKIESEDWR